jgi:predicted NBD/HSP70 family sugar kinase
MMAGARSSRNGESARGLTNFVYVYFDIGMGSGMIIHSTAFGGESER